MDNPWLIGSIKGVRTNADESRMNFFLRKQEQKRNLKDIIRIVHIILRNTTERINVYLKRWSETT